VRRIVLLGCLYFAQGLPFGFFIQAVPVLLRSSGESIEVSTLATLLAFPWGLKFLWAPVVDRARPGGAGRRRKFILPAQALIAVTLGVLSFFPPGRLGFGPLCAAFFVVSLLSAMQDVATDALALDLLADDQRGLGNGVQVGGYRLGMIAGGGGVLLVIQDLGWRTSFLGMAALIVAAAIPILLFREPIPPMAAVATEPERRIDAFFDTTRSFLRRPDVAKLFVLLVLYKAGDALSGGIVRPFLVDRGLSLAEIGKTLGIVGSVTAVAGALLGGALLRRMGVRRGLLVFATAQAAAIAVYVAVAAGPTPLRAIYAAAGVEHFLGGAATAALFASMMGFCRDESRATDYTLQACVVVAVQGLGGGLSGFIAARAGYLAHFTTALVLAALAPFAVWLAWPSRLAVASDKR
jgi:PAT family beta-lactamase induction signal transducer AmpG